MLKMQNGIHVTQVHNSDGEVQISLQHIIPFRNSVQWDANE